MNQVIESSNLRFYDTFSTFTNEPCVIQEIKNEIDELKNEDKTKDETMKMMASVLAQVLTKSSISHELLAIIVRFSYLTYQVLIIYMLGSFSKR